MTEPLGSIAELRVALDAGEVSSVRLVDHALARADALGTRLNAFLGLRAEGARADAARSDERRARGEVRSPLDGIPVAIKDNMVMQGEPTTCASRIL